MNGAVHQQPYEPHNETRERGCRDSDLQAHLALEGGHTAVDRLEREGDIQCAEYFCVRGMGVAGGVRAGRLIENGPGELHHPIRTLAEGAELVAAGDGDVRFAADL